MESRANGGAQVTDRDDKALRAAFEVGIVAQAQVGLGHAHRQFIESQLGVQLDLLLGFFGVFHAVSAVDIAGRWFRSSL